MRAFPGAFGVMTIVAADRALEVCFQLELALRFSLEPLRLWRRLTYGHTHHTVLSVTIQSLRCRRWPSSRKTQRKIALTGMLRSEGNVTLGE